MSEISAEKETNNEKEFFYDATVAQRFEYLVEENGEEFETAHHYSSKINDESAYLNWINDWNIKTKSDGESDQKYSEATCKFWDIVTEKVENFEMEGEWQKRISADEKLEAMAKVLAVAIAVNPAKNKVRTGTKSETQTIITEAFFNGIKEENVRQQKHVVTNNNREEFRKKYNRIQNKRFKEEKIGGLRRKPNILVIPQDAAIGELYDQMIIESEGFVDNKIPLRFKTTVIHHIFDSKLEEKK